MTKQDIYKLGLTEPIVAHCLQIHKIQHISWEDTLMYMVACYAKQNQTLMDIIRKINDHATKVPIDRGQED